MSVETTPRVEIQEKRPDKPPSQRPGIRATVGKTQQQQPQKFVTSSWLSGTRGILVKTRRYLMAVNGVSFKVYQVKHLVWWENLAAAKPH